MVLRDNMQVIDKSVLPVISVMIPTKKILNEVMCTSAWRSMNEIEVCTQKKNCEQKHFKRN